MMFKIKTFNKIDPQGLSLFPKDGYTISEEEQNPDAIVLRSYKMHDEVLPESLKAIARAGAGTNNIPVEKCTDKGIVVFNTPGANANGVKELVVAGLLLASRDISGAINWAKTLIGEGDQVPALVEKGKKNFAGQEIAGKTLAVYGLGAIGILVANVADKLGMHVIGFDPFLSTKNAHQLSSNVEVVDSEKALLSDADYISLNVPLLPATKGFINKDKFDLMKDGVRIVNFARGGLECKESLKEALKSGKVARYVIDFPDEDFLQMENVISIPHLGASTKESETNCALMAVKQLKNYLENGNIVNSVNFPATSMARSGAHRLTVGAKNDSIIGSINDVLEEKEITIENMISQKCGNLTYLIIDTDKCAEVTQAIDKIKAINGVILARAL